MQSLSPDRWQQVDTLFDAALDLPVDQRLAFLQEACGDDLSLYGEVLALLESDAEAERVLGESATQFAAPLLPDLEAKLAEEVAAGLSEDGRVGPYRVLREIGRGGMGAVYLAERADENFHKRVALKVVKRGLDTDEILRRFRYERQILASLEHANVARLLDGGVTGDGRPYLVMEYVEGQAIDRYCDAHRLGIEERLRLFRHVCEAVQYAHRNLVVHRDLKPSNLLVTEDGQVKLLDFGIAKLLGEQPAPRTAPVTRAGVRVMTPEYAAPEQVRGEAVTTAADVYALGVVLYELLTGHRPYDLTGKSPHEVEQIILHQEPDPPSTAVTRSEERPGSDGALRDVSPEAVSTARGTSTQRLRRRLRGDLDTILLAALAKEPERRYPSAEAFLDDIKRHLAGLPVRARRDHAGYRAWKFVRRHRFGVAAGALFVLLLAASAVSLALQQAETARQRDAVALERDRAEEVTALLTGLFAAPDPYAEERLDTLSLRTFVDRSIRTVREELAERPSLRANMLQVIGTVYKNLGLFAEARTLLEEALETSRGAHGPEHLEVAASLDALGVLLWEQGEYEESERLHREALALRRRLAPGRPELLAASLHNLSTVLQHAGDLEAAEPLAREALALLQARFGEEHSDVAEVLMNLAIIHYRRAQYEEAVAFMQRVLAVQRKLLGEEHTNVADALNNLGLMLIAKGDYDEAAPILRRALEVQRKALGDDHPRMAFHLNNVGLALREQGDLEGAEPFYLQALAVKEKHFGRDHPTTLMSRSNLAVLWWAKGDLEAARAPLEEVLATRRRVLGPEHEDALISLYNVASLRYDAGDLAGADTLLREAAALAERTLPEGHPYTAHIYNEYGACLTALGRYAEAEPYLLASHDSFSKQRSAEDEAVREVRERLAALYTAWGRPDRAAAYEALPASEPG